MKHLYLLAICTLSLAARGQEGAIACLGNGDLAVYERKADVVQLFGPSYSSPSVMRITFDTTLKVQSQRKPGTAIWKHELYRNGSTIATITDFVDAEKPWFIRHIEAQDTLSLMLTYAAKTLSLDNRASFEGAAAAALLTTPAGTYF